MKKSCKYCGGIHEAGYTCPKKPAAVPKKSRYDKPGDFPEDIFRGTHTWKLKREYIKKRDRYLCQACLHELPGTIRRVNPYDLSVHHIVPLSKDFSRRLSDGNLITLCRYHHEKAEKGEISAENLLKILQNIPPEG